MCWEDQASPCVRAAQQPPLAGNYGVERWKLHSIKKARLSRFSSLPGKINKLDTRGLPFTCVSLSHREKFLYESFSLSRTHIHSKGLATGAQPCSVVETKHWPVVTASDPCFRAERCQRRIDGSHPEEDVYRKMFLAGILPLFILHIKT